MVRPIRLLLLLLLASTISGCSLFRQLASGLHAPEIRFVGMRPGTWSLDGVQLDMLYEVKNPNDVAFVIDHVDYTLKVEGKQVLTGQPPGGIDIPASGTVTLALPTTVRFADVLPAARAVLGKDVLHYEASG